MSLNKEELALLQQLNKKISKAESASSEPVTKNYVFKVTVAHIIRTTTITAISKAEAEEIMFQRYGDLPYELIEVN
ncbi:MAG: hypothetical protein ABI763_08675 [Bacteroidota bacterium]